MNIWVTWKSLKKQNYLKKKNFIATKASKILQKHITSMQKEFVKILK